LRLDPQIEQLIRNPQSAFRNPHSAFRSVVF